MIKSIERKLKKMIRGKNYNFLPMSESKEKNLHCEEVEILPSEMNLAAQPLFFGIDPKGESISFHSTSTPSVRLYTFEDASVFGSTPFLCKGHDAIYHDQILLSEDITVAEMCNRASLSRDFQRLSFIPSNKPIVVDKAITLLGDHAYNYAHWLTEFMTRIVLVDELELVKDWPVLVDEAIGPRLLEALEVLMNGEREVIRVKAWQEVKSNKIALITPPCYFPPESRHTHKTGLPFLFDSKRFLFSGVSLQTLRKKISKNSGAQAGRCLPSKNEGEARSKIFLDRTASNATNGRMISNSDEIRRKLTSLGYFVADTGAMSFSEQVKLLSEAETVVSASGGSAANLIFAKPGCKVVLLTPGVENTEFGFFANLMSSLGHDLRYVVGKNEETKGDRITRHSNYSVCLDHVCEAVIS